jgi:hypothetical protein
VPRVAYALSLLGLASAAACSKPHNVPEPAPSTSPAPPAGASATTAATVPHVVQPKPACRALLVTGVAAVEGAPITTGMLLDGQHWVDLSAGSSVALRHTVTSREFTLLGPARILPCRNGAEQLLLAKGRLSTAANLGVRPGAEVLIATPSGSIHYGDAALDVEFGSKGLRMRVKQGEASLEPAARGKPPFKNPVRSGEARLPPQVVDAQALTQACQSAAQTARDSAEHVLGTGLGAIATLGARAAAHMRNRSAARTACAIAAAALGADADSAETSTLSAAVAHADELWQSVPHAVSGQKN